MANKSEAELRKEYEQYLNYVNSSEAGEEEPKVVEKPKKRTVQSDRSFAQVDPMAGEEFLTETIPDIITTAPQGVTSWSEDIAAAPIAAVKAPFDERSFQEIYDEEIGKLRNNIAFARERSPVGTAFGEAGTAIASSFLPIAGAGKLAGAGGQILRGAFEGLGTADDKLGLEGLVQTGFGAGLGAGGALIGGALKKVTTADPNAIRANVLGARTSEFKEIGIKERKQIAKELKDMGLFSNTKVEFDVAQGKFIPKGKTLESLEKPAVDKLEERLKSAIKKIQDEKMALLGKFKDQPIDIAEIEDSLRSVAKKYSSKATGMPERQIDAEEVIQKILIDIEQDTAELGLNQPTIEILERAKLRLSEDVGNYGKNPLLQKTPDSAQIYQNMYTSINNKLKSLIGDNKYAKFNDTQQKMLTAKHDLTKAIASDEAQKAQAGWGGWVNKALNETLGSPEAGLGMASVAEFMNKPYISPLKTSARLGVSEAPFSTMRQLDVSMPTSPTPPFAPEQDSQAPQGYNFSGIKPAFEFGGDRTPQGFDDVNPIAKMKLPRSSADWIKNKDMVLQKMASAGVPSEMIDATFEAVNEDHGKVEGLVSTIAMSFPELFVSSKYNMINGRILDPNERAKAADDMSKRDDVGSVQKAKIIRELNKSGKWLGE